MGWSLQPKLLVVTAEPIRGNRRPRLPLPPIGEGRGVSRKTSVSRKRPPTPANRALTGTLMGGRGEAAMPSRAMPWPEKAAPAPPESEGETPGPKSASLSGRLRPRNTTPVLHSSAERAPLLHACLLRPGTGSSTNEPRTRTRSLGVTIPSRTKASSDASNRWGRSPASCSWVGRRGSARSAVAGAGVGKTGSGRGNSAAGTGAGETGGGGVKGGEGAIDAAPSWAGMGGFSDWASPREVPAKGAPQAAARINGRRRRSMAGGWGRGASHQDAAALS